MDSPCGGGPAVRRSGRKSANVEPAQENQRIAGDGRRASTSVDPPTIAAARASGAVTPDRLSQPAADPAHLDRSLEALMLVAADRDHGGYLIHGWLAGRIRSRPPS